MHLQCEVKTFLCCFSKLINFQDEAEKINVTYRKGLPYMKPNCLSACRQVILLIIIESTGKLTELSFYRNTRTNSATVQLDFCIHQMDFPNVTSVVCCAWSLTTTCLMPRNLWGKISSLTRTRRVFSAAVCLNAQELITDSKSVRFTTRKRLKIILCSLTFIMKVRRWWNIEQTWHSATWIC